MYGCHPMARGKVLTSIADEGLNAGSRWLALVRGEPHIHALGTVFNGQFKARWIDRTTEQGAFRPSASHLKANFSKLREEIHRSSRRRRQFLPKSMTERRPPQRGE